MSSSIGVPRLHGRGPIEASELIEYGGRRIGAFRGFTAAAPLKRFEGGVVVLKDYRSAASRPRPH